jgi:hypothetical protein
MGCKSFGINQILIGLYRVGLSGLGDALDKATKSGLSDQDTIVDLLLETLAADNYIPESQIQAYRTALWREYLRFNKKDFRAFFSEADVVIKGTPGEELDRFVRTTTSIFADFELKPVIRLEPADEKGPNPQLIVREDTIVRGLPDRTQFKNSVQKSLTDW